MQVSWLVWNWPLASQSLFFVPFACKLHTNQRVLVVQADGGQLSEWTPMYQPSREEAEADRMAAFEARVPHGELA